ncbi:MAG: septal ring lytic transglycosylase RlpA family protein [Longimicrobiales bacterium]
MARSTVLLTLLATACASGASRPAGNDPVPPSRPADVKGASVSRTAVVRNVKPVKPGENTGKSAEELAYADRVVLASVQGEATYYANKFDGRLTASGSVFRNSHMTAAHREYPFGTIVRVTNLKNQRSVIVRVTDRGPNVKGERGQRTIIDLTQRAARELDFMGDGRVRVRVDVLNWGGTGRSAAGTR